MKKIILTALSLGMVWSALAPSVSKADELTDLMKEMGTVFNTLRSSIKKVEDLTDANRVKSQELSALLHRSVTLSPKLADLSNDPVEQQRLLTLFRKIMSETLAASFDLEMRIVTKDMVGAKASIDLLAEKRREAHDLFRR